MASASAHSNEVAFAYMKKYGATGVLPTGKPQGFEETGSVSSAIPGIGISARKTSNAPNHTYKMEADALTEVGHSGFVTDAQSMAALLYDFATRPDYRAMVKREFDSLKGLHDEYLDALRKVYVVPKVVSDKPIP